MAVVRKIRRASKSLVAALVGFDVPMIHEAQARAGPLDVRLRPIFPGAKLCGTAVPVSVPPGDHWTIHVAMEQCRDGDVLG